MKTRTANRRWREKLRELAEAGFAAGAPHWDIMKPVLLRLRKAGCSDVVKSGKAGGYDYVAVPLHVYNEAQH